MNYFMHGLEPSRVHDTRGDTASRVRIGHLNLRVADLDRATNFYCDVLGLTVSCYGPALGLPTVFLAFDDYHHHVALNWFYQDSSKPANAGHHGLNHFGIVYPDELSLAKAVSKLMQHGDLIDDARDHGGTVSVYLRDPDGNGIELYYDRPRAHWFDPSGHLIIKSEPFSVKKWLKDVLAGAAEVAGRAILPQCVAVQS
jgi:catechol 2,3-dioxygenase